MTFTQTTRTVFAVLQLGAVSNIQLFQNAVDASGIGINYDSTNLNFQVGTSSTNYIYRTNLLSTFFNNTIIACFTQITTNSTGGIFINGTSISSTYNSAPAFVTGTLSNQSIGSTSTTTFKLGETMIFDGAVSDIQRQQVEGYLAAKWGLQAQLSQIHPYFSYAITSAPATPFTPTSISGCKLWFDAADTSTYSTSSFTTWTNKGTAGGSAGSKSGTITSTTLNGLPALSFAASAGISYQAGSFTYTTTTRTAFVVAAIDASGASTDYFFMNNANAYQDITFQIRGSNAGANAGISFWSGFVNPVYKITYPPNGIFNATSLFCCTSLTTNGGIFINGTNIASGLPSNQFSTGANGVQTIGLATATAAFRLCELILFDGAISDIQRQQVEVYLANKWGLATLLPATHPYYSYPIISIPAATFTPTSIPRCVLWLDAADTTTYSTSSFTTWTNKGTAGGSTNSKVGTITSTTINGVPALAFGSLTSVTAPSTTYTQTSRTVFLVLNNVSTSSTVNTNFITQSPANNTTDIDVSTYNGNVGSSYYLNAIVYTSNLGYILGLPSIISATNTNTTSIAGAVQGLYINGVSFPLGINNANKTFSIGTSITQKIGRSDAGNPVGFTIGEVIVFDGAITDIQRIQVNNYLQLKWNIATSIAPVNNRPFAPININGCGLWLDAADASTISGTIWSDKSGGGYNVTSTNTITTTSAGITIGEDTNRTLTNASIPVPTTYSLFAVGQITSTSNIFGTYRLVNIATDVYGFLGMIGSNYATFTGNGTNWNDTTANTPQQILVPGTQYLMGMTVNGSVLTPYFNGTALNTKTGTTIASTGINIGKYSGGQVWNGNVAEVILYNTLLTNSQRLQVESYLAQKWGIRGSLPTTHPGRSLPAFGTVFTPKSIGSMQLWLDAADTSTLVTSGTSVTSWSDKSGLNNTMNVLPGSPSGYTTEYPIIGTPINNVNTVYFSPAAGLKQTTTLTSVTNFYWVGRISNVGVGATNGAYMMLGHDTYYYWHGNTFTTPSSKLLESTFGNAAAGIRAATPTSLYTSDSTSAAVNTTFGALNMPINAAIHLISATGITGPTDYQGICYDRNGANIGWCGDLAEVIIFTSALSTYQHKQVEGYLAWKWGLQAQLPATHPYYKSRP